MSVKVRRGSTCIKIIIRIKGPRIRCILLGSRRQVCIFVCRTLRRFAGSFSSAMVLISMPLWTLFWHFEMCFFTEELSLFRCFLTRPWTKRVCFRYSVSLHSKRSRTSELKCYVSPESEDSSRAKIGARAKKGKEREGGGAARERLQANPTILKNPLAHQRGF